MLVALLALLILVIRGTIQQRRLMRLLTGFLLANWLSDRVDNVASFFGGIPGAIKDFVFGVVQGVVDWASSGFDWVTSLARNVGDVAWSLFDTAQHYAARIVWEALGTVSGWVSNALSTAWGWVQSALSSAWGWVQNALSTAWGWIQSGLTNLGNWLQAVIGNVRDWLLSVIHDVSDWLLSLIAQARDLAAAGLGVLRDWLLAVIGAVRDYLLDTLGQVRDLLLGAIRDANTFLTATFRAANDALADLIRQSVADLSSTLGDVTSFLFGTVSTIVDVAIAVLDWLIALATFPFSTARDIWEAFRRTGGKTLVSRSPDFVARWGDHVLGTMKDYSRAESFDYTLAPLPPRPGEGGSGAPGQYDSGQGTPDRQRFALAILDGLGAPHTESNLHFLVAWMAREGTSATFNPLATTLDYGSNTRFNSVGVRNYADLATGVAATVATLRSSAYRGIVTSLLAGDGHAAGQQHADLRTWSGGGYDTVNV